MLYDCETITFDKSNKKEKTKQNLKYVWKLILEMTNNNGNFSLRIIKNKSY